MPRRVAAPLVVCDHDGFSSGITDGEPSVEWPAKVSVPRSWFETIEQAGPPLYGVLIQREIWPPPP